MLEQVDLHRKSTGSAIAGQPLVVSNHTIAHLLLTLEWQDRVGHQRNRYHFERFNVWRDLDLLPLALRREIEGHGVGHRAMIHFDAGELVPGWRRERVVTIAASRFPQPGATTRRIVPRLGRFYPAGWVGGVAGVFSDNFTPSRLVAIDGDRLTFDLNHPLATVPLSVGVEIISIEHAGDEHGGRCSDPLETLCRHPGFAAALDRGESDFDGVGSYARIDEADDSVFYAAPRRVHHLDRHARGVVNRLYRERLPRASRVLDLMAGWDSHLDGVGCLEVTGLGMNRQEMEENRQLNRIMIHDLNRQPVIDLANESLDAVVCCASIEYLVDPVAVLGEVRRLLRPDGVVVISFSNRWFPPKAISIWSELHEFERPALVREWLRCAGFGRVEQFSELGHSRPEDDPHIGQSTLADPLFALIAVKE